MAVRRGPKPSAMPKGAERLLSWSRHRRVPVELLKHPDVEVRVLAEVTDEAVIAFRRLVCLEPNDPEKETLEAEKDVFFERLTAIRRRYAEDRGLGWEYPDPWRRRG